MPSINGIENSETLLYILFSCIYLWFLIDLSITPLYPPHLPESLAAHGFNLRGVGWKVSISIRLYRLLLDKTGSKHSPPALRRYTCVTIPLQLPDLVHQALPLYCLFSMLPLILFPCLRHQSANLIHANTTIAIPSPSSALRDVHSHNTGKFRSSAAMAAA